ncbi:hypothetical protein ACN28S_42460 [Cystobacter fuscus]
MARALDVNVVIPPPLRPLFEGRREVSLGVPGHAGVGDVLETLLSLYPRLRQHLAGDRPATGGSYVHRPWTPIPSRNSPWGDGTVDWTAAPPLPVVASPPGSPSGA